MNVLARRLGGVRFVSNNFAPLGSALVKKKRFYKDVGIVEDVENGKPMYRVALDGRILKTQMGNKLELESQPLALAIAEEWASQEESLEIGLMRLTGLAFTATDNPLHCTKESITQKVLEYLENDTVLFYNEDSSRLFEEQNKRWTPIIEGSNLELGTKLKPITNIFETTIVTPEDKARIEKWLLSHNLWALHGLQYAVETVKSVLLPFNMLHFRVKAPEAVELSTLERRIQSLTWGEVEWHHGMEDEELLSRVSAGVLFTYFTSNSHTTTTLKA